jgi:peptidoglycan/xylan/chitin deacetylase (PgdA/CDA1 family)
MNARLNGSASASGFDAQFARIPKTSGVRYRVKQELLRVCVTCAAKLADRFPKRDVRPAILMYHRTAPPTPGVPAPTINVSPDRLEQQLHGLRQRGYQFWSLDELLEANAAGHSVPSRVVVVTFDDGFECVLTRAFPILRKLQVPATVFLPTAYLDQPDPFPFDQWALAYRNYISPESYRPMRWDQCLSELGSELFHWGAHTHTHQDFRGRTAEFFQDLSENLRQLQLYLGIQHPAFALPFGAPHLGFADQEWIDLARQLGVKCVLTTEPANVTLPSEPFGWPRFHVFSWDSAATLDARLQGWYSRLVGLAHRLIRRRAKARLPSGSSSRTHTAKVPNASGSAASISGMPLVEINTPFEYIPFGTSEMKTAGSITSTFSVGAVAPQK